MKLLFIIVFKLVHPINFVIAFHFAVIFIKNFCSLTHWFVHSSDSTATLSISLSSTMSDVGKTCFQEGETKGNSVPGSDGMTPIACNCSVHDSKVSCDIYSNSNVSNRLCFLASENVTCSKILSICNGNLTEDLQKG